MRVYEYDESVDSDLSGEVGNFVKFSINGEENGSEGCDDLLRLCLAQAMLEMRKLLEE